MMMLDTASKLAKIFQIFLDNSSVAIGAQLLHRVCAEHSIALELRLGEKLVSGALVRECFAPLKVFVNVARLIAVTCWLDVNDDAIRSGGTVDR
jgi:hypothetical protein